MKMYDVFIGRLGGWHTYRAQTGASIEDVAAWLAKGYRIETEHQIGNVLYEVYLIKP